MSGSKQEIRRNNYQAGQGEEKPARKPWITPSFTPVGDLKDAQNGNGAAVDFKFAGVHGAPGNTGS